MAFFAFFDSTRLALRMLSLAIVSPDPPEQTVDPPGDPASALQARLGPEWHRLLAGVGATRDVPAGSLSAVSEWVLIVAKEVHPELHWADSLREELLWAWLAWWSEGRRPSSGEAGPETRLRG